MQCVDEWKLRNANVVLYKRIIEIEKEKEGEKKGVATRLRPWPNNLLAKPPACFSQKELHCEEMVGINKGIILKTN